MRPLPEESQIGSSVPPSAAEVRRRAVEGAVVVALRSGWILVVGLVANLVLARLLAPRDFGLLALAMTVAQGAGFLGDAGLGAGLIRRPQDPTRAELRALVTLQLALFGSVALAAGACALAFWGTTSQLVAVVALSLPIRAFRTPGYVLLERSLSYRRLARVELVEAVLWAVLAITATALGMGVWGPALAYLPRVVFGTAMMARVSSSGWLLPGTHLAVLRAHLRFGAQFQALSLVTVAREQTVNYATAAIAGLATLGVWSLAFKAIQIPMWLFTALWRVGYPAMAALRRTGADPRLLIERINGLAAVGAVLLLAPMAAASFAVFPAVFGEQWDEVGLVLAPFCLGLQLGAPPSVASAGWLSAAGEARLVLRASLSQSIVWVVLSIALLPLLGAKAIGIAFIPAGLLDGMLLCRYVRAATGARLGVDVFALSGCLVAAVGTGWATGTIAGDGIVGALVAAAVAGIVATLSVLTIRRAVVVDLVATLRRRARMARMASPPTVAQGVR